MSYCDACAVRNRAICAALDASELEGLNKTGRRRTLKAGESLIWEGEQSILVANVIEGMLKLSTGTEDGREQIVGVVYPSDFIGRPFGATTRHSVTALTDARVCVFGRGDFDRFAGQHPALEHELLQRTLTELDRTRSWMLLLARKNAEQKIATFLLDVSAPGGARQRSARPFRSALLAPANRRCARPHHRDRQPADDQAQARRCHQPADAPRGQDSRSHGARGDRRIRLGRSLPS